MSFNICAPYRSGYWHIFKICCLENPHMRCGRIDLFNANSDSTNRLITAKSIVFDFPDVKLSNA